MHMISPRRLSSIFRAASNSRAHFAALALLGFGCFPAAAATATTTTLAITNTSSGSAVTTATPGTEITLTATVKAGSTAVFPGQVYFCDAAAAYCTDSHIVGKTSLTSSGTATFRFYPGVGAHQYKALFLGTGTYTTGTSSSSSLTVMSGSTTATATSIAQSGSAGNYTLTSTIAGSLLAYPTGSVSFVDTNHSNAILATASAVVAAPTFTTTGPYTSQVQPSAIASGDFNGDGIPDVAVANNCSTTTVNGVCAYGPIVILLGNGDGTFRSGTTITNAQDAQTDIIAGDFNGDGKLDLAVASQDNIHLGSDQYEQVFLGNGDGTFQAPKNTDLGLENPYFESIGDFNNDGKLDLALGCSENGHLCILLGKGDGTFTKSTVTSGTNIEQVVNADFDGDGKLDLAVGLGDSLGNNVIELKKGNGDGTFTANGQINLPATGSTAASASWITVADVNGDGHPDLLIAEYNNNKVYTYLNNGSGSFSVVGSGATVGGGPFFISVADFDGDGKLDMAVENNTDKTVTIYLGNGNGTFQAASSTITVGTNPYYLAIDDFNKDGRPDVANLNGSTDTNSVNILLNTGAVSRATATGVVAPGTGAHAVDASYHGDTYNAASTSGTTSLTGTAVAPTVTSVGPSSGPVAGGTPVTITGTNFTGATAVKFGNTPAAFSLLTASSISATSPAGSSGTVDVTVTTPGGTSATSTSDRFTYQAAATVTVPTVSGYSGAAVTLAANIAFSGSTPTGPVTFQVGAAPVTGTAICASSPSPETCTISYNTPSVNTATNFTITATIAADSNYASASNTGTLTVVPASYTAATTNLASTSATQTATLLFTSAATLNSTFATAIQVVTQGASGVDFNFVSGGTCNAGSPYLAGATCTVQYTFTPKYPGQRLGAIQLYSNAATPALAASALLSGTGMGPELVFPGNVATTTLRSGFTFPLDVTVDAAGNLYVVDGSSTPLKELVAVGGSVSFGAQVRTLGSGFSALSGVAVDGAGNVYVADSGSSTIKELVAVGGSVPSSNPTIRILGSGFHAATDVAVDSAGNVYVADTGNNAVKELVAVGGSVPDTNPAIRTLGSGFSAPGSIVVDAAGNVYVSDYGNNAIKEIVAVGGSIPSSPIILTLGSGFNGPQGIALDSAGNVYVADNGVSSSGVMKEIVAVGGSIPSSNATILTLGAGFVPPHGTAVDGAGHVYVAGFTSGQLAEIPLVPVNAIAFANTAVGSTSPSLSLLLQNVGNANLAFAVPTTGSNPSVSSYFTQDSSSTCPTASAGGSAGILAPGTCTEVLKYAPTLSGAVTGSLIFTDNPLNVAGTTQTIALTGSTTSGLTVGVVDQNVPPGTASITLEFTVGYGNNAKPTGTPVLTVNGSAVNVGTVACTGKTGHLNCTAAYNPSSLSPGAYTITATVPADSTYTTPTIATGTLTIVGAPGSHIAAPVKSLPVTSLAPPRAALTR